MSKWIVKTLEPFRSLRFLTGLVIVSVFLISFSLNSLQGAEKKENPGVPYQSAIDRFADLDLDRAYEWANIVIRDFPESEEAEKAILLKAMISTIKVQTFDILSKKCGEAMQKAVIYKDKKKNRKLYVEATQRAVEGGEVLVEDAKALFEYAGRPMAVEFKKNYDSSVLFIEAYLPYKMLENGYPPARKEMETIERHQSDMSYCFVLSCFLHSSSPERDEQIAKSFEKKQIIKGNVNWAGCMAAMGDWLIHYAAICKVGWIHPALNTKIKDFEKAKAGYETARRCFENVIKLSSKGRSHNEGRVRARARIKEIDKALSEINKAGEKRKKKR
ncbi:hypothetical protein KAW50_04140 [candidate division WOR-3 bacterium]|nr:hypothetical protein [candidate division WOR-3 bacterium]